MSACPSCNKFCGLENNDPEIDGLEMDDEGNITATVRCVRVSACCSEEMKECNYDLQDDRSLEIEEHQQKFHGGKKQSYSISEDGGSVDEAGGGRYQKNMITCTVDYSITCDGDHEEPKDALVGDFTWSDSTSAGSYDELC